MIWGYHYSWNHPNEIPLCYHLCQDELANALHLWPPTVSLPKWHRFTSSTSCKKNLGHHNLSLLVGVTSNYDFMIFMIITSWNPKHLFMNGCFNWMIPNLYIGNGCFTKHLFINGWPWGSRITCCFCCSLSIIHEIETSGL